MRLAYIGDSEHNPRNCQWARVVAVMLGWAGGEAEITDLEMYDAESKTLYYVYEGGTGKNLVIGVKDDRTRTS